MRASDAGRHLAGHGGLPLGRVVERSKVLLDQFDERPVAVGLSRSGTLMTLFAAPDGRTWTSVVTGPTGQACVVDVGQGLELKAQGVES